MEAVLRRALNGHATPVNAARSRAMAAIRAKGNRSTEWRLRSALVQAGVGGWKLHRREILGVPDLWFPSQRVAVFVDGCFWHGCKSCGHYPKTNAKFWRLKIDGNRNRDRRITRQLRASGVRVVRFWEHQLHSNLSAVVCRIRTTL